MKLGVMLGYWGAQPPVGGADLVMEAERLGYDSVRRPPARGPGNPGIAALRFAREEQVLLHRP